MKNHTTILTVVALLLLAQGAFSQAICAFDKQQERRLKTDAVYRKSVLANEARIKEYIRMHPVSQLNDASRESSVNVTLYTIPVVVHVVHTGGAIGSIYNPTDAQITGAINYLNQVYNGTYPGTEGVGDIQIQFALATRDTNCTASTGIDRINGSSLANYVSNGVNSSTSGGVTDLALKNIDRWDPANYYNIWVVNKIDANDGTSGQFISGYAYFAGASAAYDGTVMLATQMVTGQKTLPHEIGHALNLYHPFEGSADAASCPANTDCNNDGDKVCDTDPISQNVTGSIYDVTCRSGANTVCGGTYSINTEKNYMSYTSCFTLFTAGQKARMMAAMSLPSRAILVSSSAIGAYPLASYTPPVTASCIPVTGSAGLSGYFAGIMNVAVSNKSFPSGATADDGGYNNKTNKCLYLIQLQKNNTYSFSASLLAANREQLRVWIDYNNDGIFSNATEQIYYSADIIAPGGGNYANISTNFTVPASATASAVLRMRVIDELSSVAFGPSYTITGACYNPSYGQAEDYPIYLSALLPVKFDYFRGTKKNNDAILSWKTSFEQNAKEFQVEKSADGIAFDLIGTVPATNIANGTVYSFTDKNITAASNYYRLKQVDKDLKAELSQTVLIKTAADGTAKLKVIKNPFNNQLDILLSGIQAGNTTFNLFDITGRKVFSRNYKTADGQLLHIDVAGLGLKAGMYMLQAQTGNQLLTAKVIKQ